MLVPWLHRCSVTQLGKRFWSLQNFARDLYMPASAAYLLFTQLLMSTFINVRYLNVYNQQVPPWRNEQHHLKIPDGKEMTISWSLLLVHRMSLLMCIPPTSSNEPHLHQWRFSFGVSDFNVSPSPKRPPTYHTSQLGWFTIKIRPSIHSNANILNLKPTIHGALAIEM